LEDEVSESGFAGEVLQGDSAGAFGYQVGIAARDWCAQDHLLLDLAGGGLEGEGCQGQGIELGAGDAGVREDLDSAPDSLAQGRPRP
jgi:hypothetical protein